MKTFFVLIVLVLVAAAAVGVMFYNRAAQPYKGYTAAEQFVEIAPGSSTRAIGQSLIAGGVIQNDATFRVALWRTGAARALKAGTYRFKDLRRLIGQPTEQKLFAFADNHPLIRNLTVYSNFIDQFHTP
jgi:cell division protein YceG involved in septum cleavage